MKYLLSILSALVFVSCRAQPKTPATSLLWEISGPTLKEPSYLFGTMHLLCDSDLVVTKPLQKAFDETHVVYLELDMDDAGTLMQSMMGMMMKNGESLENLLNPSLYDSVSKKFTAITGIPMMMMKTMKPMMTSAMLYPFLLGCGGEGWDMKFASMAKKQTKEVHGLEDVSTQLAVFDSIPYKDQADMLASMIMNLDSTKKSFDELIRLYKQRDVEKLAAMTTEDKSVKGYESIMLDNRNKNWIPVITKAVKTTPSFIAVGAAHLGGRNGVIALLRQQGFILKPVAF